MCDIKYEPYPLTNEYVFTRATTEEHKNKRFNRSGKGARRFDPLWNADGSVIGATYLALSANVALQQTHIRRDSVTGLNTCTYIKEKDTDKNPSLLTQTKVSTTGPSLNFIDLETTTIDGEALAPYLRLGKDELSLEKTKSAYAAAQWAAMVLLDNIEGFHGFTWHSYQRNVQGERCFVLFDKWCKDLSFKLMNEIELRSLSGTMALTDVCKSVDATMYIVE